MECPAGDGIAFRDLMMFGTSAGSEYPRSDIEEADSARCVRGMDPVPSVWLTEPRHW